MKSIRRPIVGAPDGRAVEAAWRGLFIGFLAAGYVVAPNPLWAFIFYAGLAPLTLWGLIRGRLRGPWTGSLVVAGFLVIGWFWLSVAWGEGQPLRQAVKYLEAGPINLVFFVAGVSFFATADRTWRRNLARALALAGGVNALVSVAWFVGVHSLDGRLAGFAETRHPILGAAVASVAALHAVLLFAEAARWRERLLWGACVALIAAFVALTGSRGPAIAFCLSVLAMTGLLAWRAGLALAAAGLAAGLGAWQVGALQRLVMHNVERPSYRLQIWQDTLALVAKKPLLGYGIGSQELSAAANWSFPHSVYLSALYYGGAIGLVLLLALLGLAAWQALRLPDRAERALCCGLLLVPVLNGLTDVGQVIKPPGSVWYILWVPLMTVAGARARQHPGALDNDRALG